MSARTNLSESAGAGFPRWAGRKQGLLGGMRANEIITQAIAMLILAIGAAFIFLPIAFMLGTALKDKSQLKMFPPPILPYSYAFANVEGEQRPLYETTTEAGKLRLALFRKAPGGVGVFVDPDDPSKEYTLTIKEQRQITYLDCHWGNFREAFESQPFGRYFVNTCIVVFVSMAGVLVSSSMVAYGFSRFRSRILDVLFIVLLSTIMLPGQVRMIPLYVIFQRIGWVDTLLPLIVPSFFSSAYDVFLLRQFFMSIPSEMDDAAKIDGANRLQAFLRVILPQSTPALFSVCILHFMWAWNDFYEPLIYLHSQARWTIAVGLQTFNAIYTENTHLIMAASTILVLPPILLFLLSQRVFVQGVVISGVKG